MQMISPVAEQERRISKATRWQGDNLTITGSITDIERRLINWWRIPRWGIDWIPSGGANERVEERNGTSRRRRHICQEGKDDGWWCDGSHDRDARARAHTPWEPDESCVPPPPLII